MLNRKLFRLFLTLVGFVLLAAPAGSQTESPTGEGQRVFRTPRVFNPVPCHHVRHAATERADIEPTPMPRWMMNYDMEPSIARSDSFDVHTYELDLDVTNYSY